MELLEELAKLNVDTDEALKRFLNDKPLYIKMLLMFPQNIGGMEVLSYIDNGDYAKAKSNAHSLKGVTGHLALTPLYRAYTKIDELLKSGDADGARALVVDILPVQQQIIECINRYG